MKKHLLFWFDVLLTMVVEAGLTYLCYYYLIQRGYMVTFRMVVSTEGISYQMLLILFSALFSAFTLGILKEKETGDVQTIPQFFLSYVKHPITMGSVLLFLTAFFISF